MQALRRIKLTSMTVINTDDLMRGAIAKGLYNLSSPFPVDCPTGTCIWQQPFMSLGVCSSCIDVTNTTSRDCYAQNDNGPEICYFTTPSGHNLTAQSSISGSGEYHTLLNVTAKTTDGGYPLINIGGTKFDQRADGFVIHFRTTLDCHNWRKGRIRCSVEVQQLGPSLS
jgi:hypothetical protein